MFISRSLLAFFAMFAAIPICNSQEKARTFNCEGSKIEPASMNPSPMNLKITIGPGNAISIDGAGVALGSRFLSDNKIQFRFYNKDFTGEYFHYTGDLFLIYKTKHLARLTCKAA